jgi:hypothetical protein
MIINNYFKVWMAVSILVMPRTMSDFVLKLFEILVTFEITIPMFECLSFPQLAKNKSHA